VDSAYVRYLTQERFFGAAVFPGTGIEAVGDAHDGRVPEYSGSGHHQYPRRQDGREPLLESVSVAPLPSLQPETCHQVPGRVHRGRIGGICRRS
jgi:hypothetical protein